MKLRLLVMNGQKILQAEQQGGWVNQRVERAGGLKPGFYNLFAARPADKALAHDGLIVHSDSAHVYQQVGRALVFHLKSDFTKPPEPGAQLRISYDSGGKPTVSDLSVKLSRGRTR